MVNTTACCLLRVISCLNCKRSGDLYLPKKFDNLFQLQWIMDWHHYSSTCIFFVQVVNDLCALEITRKTPGISFPFHIHMHWQHACCLIRVIPCILCKCREICIYQKVLITVSTNNNNLLLFMNNGLIPLLLYVYLLCSGGRQPWRRILLYGPPGTGDHLQSNLY